MAGFIDKAVSYGVGLLIVFLLTATIILPQFSTAWRYCQAKEWVGAEGGTNTNCTTPYRTANTTMVDHTADTHTEAGDTSPVADDNGLADNFCLNCATLGGYRTTVQGLAVLALAMAFIGFAIYFFPKRTFGI